MPELVMVFDKEDANWIIDRGRDKMLVKMVGERIVDVDTDLGFFNCVSFVSN